MGIERYKSFLFFSKGVEDENMKMQQIVQQLAAKHGVNLTEVEAYLRTRPGP